MSRALSGSALVAGLFVLPVAVLPAAAVVPRPATVAEERKVPEDEACPDTPLEPGETPTHVGDRGPLPELLGLDEAHQLARGEGVGVAVVDVGVATDDPTHRYVDVAEAVAVEGVKPGLQDTHGTMVAGLVAGSNGKGEALGVAPDAHVVSIKVADARGEKVEASNGELAGVNAPRVAAGIRRAVELRKAHRIRVVNVSLNLDRPSPEVAAAVELALANRMLVVASVGNRTPGEDGEPKVPWEPGEDHVQSPATIREVLGVTGLGADDTLDPNLVWTGKQVDVSAPSFAAVTVAPGGVTCRINVPGSSWAAAEVSGLAALLFQHVKGITPQQVATRIMATAQGGTVDNALDGHGMVQPLEALNAELDISPRGKLTRAADHEPAQEKVTPPALPTDENAPARRSLLWWGLGAGGLLIAALLLRPLARRRG